jgi:hypothetical protein
MDYSPPALKAFKLAAARSMIVIACPVLLSGTKQSAQNREMASGKRRLAMTNILQRIFGRAENRSPSGSTRIKKTP